MLVIPELGSDEQFVSGDTTLADGSSNGFFGAVAIAGFYQPVPLLETVGHLCVHFCSINMAIAGLDCFLDGTHLCLWILPGTESESWNFGTGVELVSCARHDSNDNVSLIFECL